MIISLDYLAGTAKYYKIQSLYTEAKLVLGWSPLENRKISKESHMHVINSIEPSSPRKNQSMIWTMKCINAKKYKITNLKMTAWMTLVEKNKWLITKQNTIWSLHKAFWQELPKITRYKLHSLNTEAKLVLCWSSLENRIISKESHMWSIPIEIPSPRKSHSMIWSE